MGISEIAIASTELVSIAQIFKILKWPKNTIQRIQKQEIVDFVFNKKHLLVPHVQD